MAAEDTNGSTLFGRRAKLTIATPSGNFATTGESRNAIVITGADDPNDPGLRITWRIAKTTQKDPNPAEIVVYNLAPSTRSLLEQIGARVLLEAGYASAGILSLYLGDVRTVDHEREGPDWKSTFKCGDGERSVRFARASESFAGGVTVGEVVLYCAHQMGLALGNTGGAASKLSKVLYQGWTVHGAASTELERILRGVGYSYSIQDGEIQVLAPDESLAQSIPEVSSSTGLIGSPQLGSPEKASKAPLLKFRSLLIPAARAGGRVLLRSERYNGVYRARKIEHRGDVRGGEWYTDWEAVADSTAQPA